jgi:hypothetical protein
MPKFLHLREGPIQISLHAAPLLEHAIEVHENTGADQGDHGKGGQGHSFLLILPCALNAASSGPRWGPHTWQGSRD